MSQIVQGARHWISLIRLTPFETDSLEGRSNERLRRVALTALSSGLAQGINLLTVLISVPLTLNYLGVERYGLWMTISSLVAILGFADMGLGNGLLNAIADAHGRNDRRVAELYVSSAFFILSGISLLIGILWVILYPRVSWSWLFNVTTPSAKLEAGPTISVLIGCMVVGLPVGLVQKIHEGYQEGYINGLWRAAGSLLGLGSVLIGVYVQAGLPWLVLAIAGSPILTLSINAILLFSVQRPWLLPRWRIVDWTASMQILKNGLLFFVLQLAVAIGFQSDNIVIARFLGASQVSQYAVPMKLFMVIPTLIGFVLTPLWPAYGEAIARRDVTWVMKTFRRSLLLSFVMSLLPSVFLVIFGAKVIEFWAGPEIQPALILLIGIGVWMALLGLAGPISMLLNGANVIGFQVACAILMAAGNLSLSIILVQRIGVAGPVYASVISWLVFSFLPITFYIPKLFSSWNAMVGSERKR